MKVIHQHFKYIKRSKGHSAIAAAAYRSGERLHNRYDDMTHDFTKRRGIVFTQILLPENAPDTYLDRETLWNAVELGEKCHNAQLAREFDVSLDRELDREEQIELILGYVQKVFVDRGMCADIAIHDKGDGNPHAHVMLTLRSIDKNGRWMGKWKKNYILDRYGNKVYDPIKKQYKIGRSIPLNDWNDKGNVEMWRREWAEAYNRALELKGLEKQVTHMSYERQDNGRKPTIYLGRRVLALAARGIETDRYIENEAIKEHERRRREREQDYSYDYERSM